MNDVTEKQLAAVSVAPRVVPQDLEDEIIAEQYDRIPNTNATVCTLTLKNGIIASGINHGSVDPANFDEQIGNQYARKGAIEKMWPLLGFRLADKLHLIRKAGAPSGRITELGHPVTYVGTKVIHAVAMTRLDYNILRGWELPADENGEDNGYLVQYADGGKPNVAGFDGYVSWSPADVFARAYDVGVRKEPSTFISRMRDEFDELSDRYHKLDSFVTGPNFSKLPDIEQEDLTVQRGAMHEYLQVLSRRIERNTR